MQQSCNRKMRNVTAGWGAEAQAEAEALGVALCIVARASPLRLAGCVVVAQLGWA